MSHISLLDAEIEDLPPDYRTPHTIRKVKSLAFHRNEKTATKNNFTPFVTPAFSRKTNVLTDLVAQIEEEENAEILQEIKSKTWKLFTASPFFRFKTSSPEKLEDYLNEHFEKFEIKVEIAKGLRGNREDADCLKIQSHGNYIFS